jgi:hypothetical protein
MKRLFLVASLCTAAFVAAPIAAASAAEKGACVFEGKATFTPELTFAPVKGVTYSFKAEGAANACVTEKRGVLKVVEASVEGKANAGCKEGESEPGLPGKGKLKLEGEEKAKEFEFTFKAKGTQVQFKTTGGVKAEGEASFAVDKEGVQKCLVEEKPVPSLKFVASAQGEV